MEPFTLWDLDLIPDRQHQTELNGTTPYSGPQRTGEFLGVEQTQTFGVRIVV